MTSQKYGADRAYDRASLERELVVLGVRGAAWAGGAVCVAGRRGRRGARRACSGRIGAVESGRSVAAGPGPAALGSDRRPSRSRRKDVGEVGILAELLDQLLLIASASSTPARLEGGLGDLPLFLDVLTAVLDRVFELLDALQGQQVPFSFVGIVGVDLLGELLPLADGGQVVLSLGGLGRQLVGDDKLSFGIVAGFA